MMKNAYFAGGCFWCIAPVFREMEGVESVISGYCGGDEENPSYEDVKAQRTHHRETICIVYDPEKASFTDLLSVFLESVDPFDSGGQYIDRGASYTLAVFYANEEEKTITEKLLAAPDPCTPKGIRDKAMLELLYATGMRVSELISLTTEDVNFRYDYVRCGDGTKSRVVPFGDTAKEALRVYLAEGREKLLRGKDDGSLFLNTQGKRMTRQGFWKVLKGYAQSAEIAGDITPHTLRHSFAAHMLYNGADLKSLQEMLGHADISSTQFYAGNGLSYMRDVYNKAHPRNKA